MLDRVKFGEGMALLCEIYERQPNDILLRAYYEALKHLSDDQFQNACMNVMQTRKFSKLPLPADLVECIRGDADELARLALVKLEGAMSTVGGYRSIVFDDPGIHRVVHSMGGWHKLCGMEQEEWKFSRHDFMKIYKAVSDKSDMQTPLHLAGRTELDNNANGYRTAKVQVEYYGDKTKALEWVRKADAIQITDDGERLKLIASNIGKDVPA